MTANINGIRLSYSDTGSGIPLLCLHGGMGIDAGSLRVPGIVNLARHGIRVIIPDQRGHGDSGGGSAEEYSHAVWADDARELGETLGLSRFALLGHSYGGFLALEFAIRWPQLLTHLVLVATSAGPVRAQVADVSTDSDLREFFRGLWPGFFLGENKHWTVFDSLQFNADPYRAAFTRELPAYDVRERITALHVPTLLVVGRGDHYLAHMEWLLDRISEAELLVLEDVGHFPFIEAESEFTSKVAAFLTAHT